MSKKLRGAERSNHPRIEDGEEAALCSQASFRQFPRKLRMPPTDVLDLGGRFSSRSQAEYDVPNPGYVDSELTLTRARPTALAGEQPRLLKLRLLQFLLR